MPANTPQMGGSNYPFTFKGPMQRGVKLIYHSDPQYALLLGKNFAPGYGALSAGTVMAVNTSAAGNTGKVVPYVKTPTAAVQDDVAKTYAVSDVANAATTIKVALKDSFRFIVGDDLMLCNYSSGAAVYHNGGAITAIDRTTTPGVATITFTTAVAVATFTVANAAACYVEAGTSGKYCKAKYILDMDIDTGEDSTGLTDALGSVIVHNAILNKPLLTNYDSAAETDLGSVTDAAFVILK